jgi:hypothetical protein
MKNPKFNVLQFIPLSILVVGVSLLTACADEPPPSFVERSYDKTVSMTVDTGDAVPGASDEEAMGSEDNVAVEETFPIPMEEDGVSEDGNVDSADDVVAEDGSADEGSEGGAVEESSGTTDSGTTSGGKKPTFGGSDKDFDDDTNAVTDSEAARCAKHFNTSAGKIKIAGKSKREALNVDASSVVAIKLSGNQSRLDLSLDSVSGAAVRGLCIFQSGNQTSAHIEISTNIKNFVYYARGNQPTGDIVLTGGAVLENSYFSLAGNGASIRFASDAGQCPSASIRGNGAEFICE